MADDAARRRLRRPAVALAIAVLLAACALRPTPASAPPQAAQGSAPAPGGGAATGDGELVAALQKALKQVEALQSQVDAGRVVGNFGQRAASIVAAAMAAAPELEAAIDGHLQALFLRQLGLLRSELLAVVERDIRPGTAAKRAEKAFQQRAERLVRPGSDWSFQGELEEVSSELAQAVDMRQQLYKEKERAARTQRATADVVGRMQKQMDQLGSQLRGVGAGSPWTLWTSYRLPGTPYQMSARYQEGRTNIELNLSPAADPTQAEAGFVEGLTARNLGLSLNIGV